MSTDLTDHFAVPRSDFYELTQAAYNNPPAIKDRIAGTVQSTAIFAGLAAAGVGFFWGVAKVQEWAETREDRRKEAARTTSQ